MNGTINIMGKDKSKKTRCCSSHHNPSSARGGARTIMVLSQLKQKVSKTAGRGYASCNSSYLGGIGRRITVGSQLSAKMQDPI
jgi:hypothetical protein